MLACSAAWVVSPKRGARFLSILERRNDAHDKEAVVSDPKAGITGNARTQKQGNQATVGERARERLLAELPVAERRLRLNGISTAVLEGGDGPPVVLLHGPGEYAAKWLNVIPDLARTHRVIAPDLPGHGGSEVADGPLDEDRVLGWLDDLIECTCPSPPALVGQILGGALAARYAIEHGERLGNLLLVDSLGLAAFQPAADFGAALSAFVSKPTEDTHDRLWRRCAFDFDALRKRLGSRWEWIKSYNLDRARAPQLRAAQHALMAQFGMPAIPPAGLARIAAPTTLIWGRHDLATPLPVAEAASERYGWPLRVIENCADDPPMEQPEAFLEALRAALADTKAAWDRIATGYDRVVTATHLWLGSEGLRRAGLRRGMRFLDVAAGSGALSIPAARLGAQVLATDQSAAMLRLLGERARREGLEVDTRVMDGHALALEDNSFDMAGSQFGVMLFPDMPKGIRELARVVKPGGRVLMSVFGDPRRVEFFAFFLRAIQSVRADFSGPPMDPPPLPFQLQDPGRLRNELAAAGLHAIKVETITETMEFRTGEALWDWLLSSNPIPQTLLESLHLTDGERGTIQQALEKLVRERAADGGVARLTNPINIGVGTK